jgi:cytochrome c peroxidase
MSAGTRGRRVQPWAAPPFLAAVALTASAIMAACGDTHASAPGASDAGAGGSHEHDAHSHGNVPNETPTPLPDGGGTQPSAEYTQPLPVGFPKPYVPATNPLSISKIDLGRHLFYDARLSGNGTQSCASCHEQARAFTDGKERAVGSTGQTHPRNSMMLVNVGYGVTLTWANPALTALEVQAGVPMFGIDPIVELGLRGHEDEALARLHAEPLYPRMFTAAFPDTADAITMVNVQRALATFQRTIISGNSPFDRYVYQGKGDALTAKEKRGYDLFRSESLECFHCHGGFNFTDSVTYQGLPQGDANFHNTGLYNVDGKGGFPTENRGLIEFTGVASDMGRFKAPSLRNVEKTAPYMHDGSIATLEDVIDHYAAGGRTISSGPNAGVGRLNPYKSGFIGGFLITDEDKAALVAFLRSLTDQALLTSPALSDPWLR